ncbi:MAG: DUF2752 domain-containing protein [Flavobacteriales bacterium]|jgi:hypothetical protein|nr:DUF2752 domain-containing protein [Flavobacteriales bacterium]
MLKCHWKETFGVECMGCGFQRSLMALLEGDFLTSLSLFPATIPLLFTFVYTVAHLIFGYQKGARNIIILFSFSAFLMLANFIYKIATSNPLH